MPTLFEYQLDLLKIEIETINASIRQMDNMTEKVKNWAIVTWAAATGATISQEKLQPFIAFTCFIPIVFWLTDTWYRRIQRKFIWRSRQIAQFLNDGRLERSFAQGSVVDFHLFDPSASRARGPDYQQFVNWRKVMMFRSLSILYIGMSFMSLLAAALKYLLVRA